jgi:hypothetical protein
VLTAHLSEQSPLLPLHFPISPKFHIETLVEFPSRSGERGAGEPSSAPPDGLISFLASVSQVRSSNLLLGSGREGGMDAMQTNLELCPSPDGRHGKIWSLAWSPHPCNGAEHMLASCGDNAIVWHYRNSVWSQFMVSN